MKTQFLCHERDTMGPQIHPQGLGGGSRPGAQGKAWRSFLHPTGLGGAPLTRRLLETLPIGH